MSELEALTMIAESLSGIKAELSVISIIMCLLLFFKRMS